MSGSTCSNAKRDYLMRLRQTHGLLVNVALDDTLAAAEHGIERLSSEAATDDGAHLGNACHRAL